MENASKSKACRACAVRRSSEESAVGRGAARPRSGCMLEAAGLVRARPGGRERVPAEVEVGQLRDVALDDGLPRAAPRPGCTPGSRSGSTSRATELGVRTGGWSRGVEPTGAHPAEGHARGRPGPASSRVCSALGRPSSHTCSGRRSSVTSERTSGARRRTSDLVTKTAQCTLLGGVPRARRGDGDGPLDRGRDRAVERGRRTGWLRGRVQPGLGLGDLPSRELPPAGVDLVLGRSRQDRRRGHPRAARAGRPASRRTRRR